MIIDKIQNIYKYDLIPKEVAKFLSSLTPDSKSGHYEISDGAFVNIDVYNTKDIAKCKLEAHKKYIDIQMLLCGQEQLHFIDIQGLNISEKYDSKKDVMFFEFPSKNLDKVMLEPFKFVMLEPSDAHMPQINALDKSLQVKKVVAKILV